MHRTDEDSATAERISTDLVVRARGGDSRAVDDLLRKARRLAERERLPEDAVRLAFYVTLAGPGPADNFVPRFMRAARNHKTDAARTQQPRFEDRDPDREQEDRTTQHDERQARERRTPAAHRSHVMLGRARTARRRLALLEKDLVAARIVTPRLLSLVQALRRDSILPLDERERLDAIARRLVTDGLAGEPEPVRGADPLRARAQGDRPSLDSRPVGLAAQEELVEVTRALLAFVDQLVAQLESVLADLAARARVPIPSATGGPPGTRK